MMLTDLADACRTTGLKVVEVPGWRTRGHGEMSDIRTIVCHHTATTNRDDEAPSLRYIQDRGLSQLVLGRSGTVYVVGAGKMWHAGVVHESWMGNSYAIGVEAEHEGLPGIPWQKHQYDAYVRLVRGLARHYNVPAARVLGHKEVAKPTGRKTDPTFDMNKFRADIADDEEDDDMPYTEEQLSRIVANAVHGSQIGRSGLSLAVMLERTYSRSQEAAAGVTRVASALGERPDVQVDTDELAAAIAAAIPADLAQRVIDALGERINTPTLGRQGSH